MGQNFGFRLTPGVPPPPGSPAAKSMGCLCPAAENAALSEAVEHGEATWKILHLCPIHGIDMTDLVDAKQSQKTRLKQVDWLKDMQKRRLKGHPESVHDVTIELVTHNLWAAQLDAMAQVQGVELCVLLHRYLIRGLEADLKTLP